MTFSGRVASDKKETETCTRPESNKDRVRFRNIDRDNG